MRRVRGFTLIELLVALFIAAVMFAIGYGALEGFTAMSQFHHSIYGHVNAG